VNVRETHDGMTSIIKGIVALLKEGTDGYSKIKEVMSCIFQAQAVVLV